MSITDEVARLILLAMFTLCLMAFFWALAWWIDHFFHVKKNMERRKNLCQVPHLGFGVYQCPSCGNEVLEDADVRLHCHSCGWQEVDLKIAGVEAR